MTESARAFVLGNWHYSCPYPSEPSDLRGSQLCFARADDHFASWNISRKTICTYPPRRGHFARNRSAPPAFFLVLRIAPPLTSYHAEYRVDISRRKGILGWWQRMVCHSKRDANPSIYGAGIGWSRRAGASATTQIARARENRNRLQCFIANQSR